MADIQCIFDTLFFTQTDNYITLINMNTQIKKPEKIKAELPGGFRDYLPENMIPRQRMFDIIRASFERFGFVPLDTPGIEYEDTLTGRDPNFNQIIFRVTPRPISSGPVKAEEEEGVDIPDGMALRFDLTVPLARLVSQYGSQLPRPFKRYQVGKVWRGERPQAGRYREFVQFDADIVGCDRLIADAEVIELMYQTLTALGIKSFTIKVNNRKILNGLPAYVGFDQAQIKEVLRIIDKLDKKPWADVADELADKIGLGSEQLAKLKCFLDLTGDTPEALLQSVLDLMPDSPSAVEGATELLEITKHLSAQDIAPNSWKIDLSVARGLGYYTGPVFETILNDLPSIGSVFSGGRYDGLVERFSDQAVPAVGASVGVDRLFAALEKLDLIKRSKTTTRVMVLNFDPTAEGYVQQIAAALRREGINTEIYLGKETNLKGQLNYAIKQEVEAVVIAGGTEMSENKVQVKHLGTRQQQTMEFMDAMFGAEVSGFLNQANSGKK